VSAPHSVEEISSICKQKWSIEEVDLFEEAFCIAGKNFSVLHKIFEQRCPRDIKEIVEFYYDWKVASDRMIEEESDSEICFETDDSETSQHVVNVDPEIVVVNLKGLEGGINYLSGTKRKMENYPEFVELQTETKKKESRI